MEHKFNFPETLEFGKSKYGDNGLIAKQNFKKGDVIYEDSFQILDFNYPSSKGCIRYEYRKNRQ